MDIDRLVIEIKRQVSELGGIEFEFYRDTKGKYPNKKTISDMCRFRFQKDNVSYTYAEEASVFEGHPDKDVEYFMARNIIREAIKFFYDFKKNGGIN